LCGILLKSNVLGISVGICGKSSTFEQIHLQWKIPWEVEFLNNRICLSTIFGFFYKVWMLALHGLFLPIFPQPLSHDNPHREEI
jgi:hypothetical protein